MTLSFSRHEFINLFNALKEMLRNPGDIATVANLYLRAKPINHRAECIA